MKLSLTGSTRRRVARIPSILFVSLLLAICVTIALRGASADTLGEFGITEQSRLGKLIQKIMPRTQLIDGIGMAAPFATLTVTNGNDTGSGSLRNAISSANSGDTIIFSGVTTVTLTGGELVINKNLTINGGTNGVAITRSGVPQFRILNISSGTVSLTKLFISNGDHSGQAGGIQNSGTLTMTDCVITNNTSPQGGGIQNDSVITLVNCTISNNHSSGNGGGLVSYGTSNTLTNCTISDNQANGQGGGFSLSAGSLTLTNCTVASNNAPGGGGGIYSGTSSPVTLKNTIVTNNAATSGNPVEIGGNNVQSSSSYNLIGVSGTGGLTDGVNGNQVGIADAMLAGLANNGAITPTRALLPGSPAADKGSAAAGVTTDQRGQPRPFDIPGIPAASGGNNSDIGAYEAQVNCAALTLNPTSLPNGSVGTSYSQTVTASGGETPYTFSVTSGSLPSGLNLASDGTLSGFPDTAGSYNFTVTATYSFGCTGNRAYSMTITPCGNVKNYTVNDLGDAPDATPGNSVCATSGGVCTLRAAIEELNALSGCSNTINFSVTGIINLTSALPALAATLSITGPGADMLTVQRSTVSGTPNFRVFNIGSGRGVTMSGLTISNGNLINDFETGAGILNAGTLTLTNCALTNNELEFGNDTGLGGAIYNSGILTVTGSYIGTNHADYIRCKGAGIYNAGTATITNSTFTGNTIYHNSTQGGGLYNASGATATVNHCTFSGNETSGASFSDGGNIFSASGGTLNLKNTIVANGVASQTGPDIAGSFTSQGNNLIENTSGASFTAQATDITGQDPKLAAQANNGGTTLTMNLLPGSPALDKGSAGLTTDQRGLSRPIDLVTPSNADNGNDIGALEVGCSTITLTSSLPNAPVGFAYSQQLAASGSLAPYTFTVITGALPSGFTLSSTGVLAGQATTATTANFTIRATDGYGCTGTQAYAFSIVNCASPTTYTVNDLGDGSDATAGDGACATSGGVCTLRAAIQEINAAPGCANTINFSVTGTINLSSALPSLNAYFNINGSGANQLTVRRNSGTYRIFNIDVGNSANISGLTISNGRNDEGGGIRNAGGLNLTACALIGNQSKGTDASGSAGKTGGGGAIFNDATGLATVTRSILNGNSATGGNGELQNGGGGGGGALGAGIFNNGGQVTVTNTTISGNTATGGNGANGYSLPGTGPGGKGGGNGGNGGNGSGGDGGTGGFGGGGGGGAHGSGTGGTGGRFGGGGGGGQSFGVGGSGGFLGGGGKAATSSSQAGGGGGGGAAGGAIFNNGGTFTLVNATVVSNTAQGGNAGGGGNGGSNGSSRAGGIYNEAGTLTIKNSIVAGNSAQETSFADCDSNSPITTSGYNLFGSGTGCPTGGTQDQTIAAANLFTTVLGPLGYYGGTTQTYRSLTGSPVIDKGASHSGITVDQRNKTRPVDIAGVSSAPGGNASDIGAYEAQTCSTVIIAPNSLANIDIGSPYSQTFTGSGGTAPYTFAVTAGTLPTGLTLSLAGVLSGTPTALGAYNFTITMSDENGCVATQAYTTNVVCPTITLDPTSLPNSVQGASYSQTINVTGGTGTTSFSVTAGALPGGLTLGSSSGVVSGTPNTSGTFTFTITATRQYGCFGNRQYTVVIGPCVNAFTVNNLGDGADAAPGNGICETATGNGVCTLRAAIQEANTLPGCAPHTITIGVNGTIDLATALPDLNANMTINGPGASLLTVRRSTAGGTPDFTVVTIASSRTVTLNGLTISNGRNSIGAGVRNNGILTIESCVITGNTAYSLGTGFGALSRGGGIFQSGSSTSLTLSNSTVSGNQSIAETTDTNGADAQGAGIQRTSGAITIINSTISGNTAQSITPNATSGTARGGGFYLSSNGTLTVTNATISNNSVSGGDTANEGGGVYRDPSATGATNFKNTIITGNDASTGPDMSGTMISQGFNLIGKSDGGTGFTDGTNNDLVGSIASPRNALLATLGNYGGATPTHALLPGSPAINVGTSTGAPTTDQRGITRPQQTSVDIGAFESRGFTLAISAGNNQSTTAGTNFSSALIVMVTSANGEPMDGGQLMFTVPGSGPSCTLTNNPAIIASGLASTGTVTANGTVGGPYLVSATANGVVAGVNFSLTNITPNTAPIFTPVASISVQKGSLAGAAIPVGTVSDAQTAAGSLTVTQIAGGTATGITVTGITNTNGTITAVVTAGCLAVGGTVRFQVSDGILTNTGDLTVTATANTPPSLSYGNVSVNAGASTSNSPTTPTDNGSITGYNVQSQGTYTGTISVNASGIVSISGAAPVGAHTITIRATDNCGSTTDAMFTLTVSNNLPTITAGAALSRQRGSAGTVSTIATVSDGETPVGSLTVTATTVPAGLTVTGITNTAGTIMASVAADCTATIGANTVVLTVTDGNSGTTTANLTVTVTANTAATVAYGNVSVNAGGSTSNSPTSATDNGSITGYAVQSQGTFTGTISVNASGIVSISNAAPVGAHTITIRATDNCNATTDAAFTLTIGNNLPTITAGAALTRQRGSAGTVGTIATVSDGETPIGSLTVTATTVPAGLTVTSITNTAGTIMANVAASCTATIGTNTIVLTVTDGNSGAATANLTVNVTANIAPTVIYAPASVNAGNATTNSPTTATDNGSITGYAVQSQGTYTGTISVNSSGVVSISNAAPVGAHTITIRATDNCFATADAMFTLNVGNNLPTITAGAALTRQRGSAGTVSTVATVSDGETPIGSLVVTATTVPAGITVTSITNTAGTILANVAADCSAALGNNTVVLTVTDGNSGTATASLTITVTANTAPSVTYANVSVNAGASTSNAPTSATDNGGITGYAVQSAGTYTGTISVNPTTGAVSISNAAPVGVHTITIRATDNCGAPSGVTDATFTLTVGNNAPTITAGAALTRQRGTAGSVNTIATVSDGETPVGSLTVTATTVPAGLTVTSITNTAGTITANVAASCTAIIGANTVVLTVTDGNSGTATANLTVTVTANTAPTVTYGNVSVNAGGSTSNSPTSATDNGSITGYAVQSQGTFTGTISVNPTNGAVSISNATPVGAHTITIRATDNCNATTDATFTLTVGNNLPTITAASTLIRQQGSNGIVAPIATVSDGETSAGSLVVTATTVPTGISVTSISNSNGTVSANVAAGCNAAIGNNTVVLTVTDGNSGIATANLIVNVIDNAVPALVYPASSIALGGSTTINPTTATDNGSITGFSIVSVTPAMTTAPTVSGSGVVSITNAGSFGSHTIVVRATDNCNVTTDASFTLNVGCGSIAISPASLVNGLTFVSYTATLSATGGSGSYTFSLQSGTLPAGLNLSGNLITGTPTTPGADTFTIRATDTNGCFGDKVYTLNIGSTGLMYYPLARPVRLLDTRPGASPNACNQPNAPIAGGNFRLQPARGACEGITIPANATTITGHITTVQSGGGFLTLYPSDAPQPTVTNSNYLANEILNNAFTVGLGASDGAFKLFVSSNTDVVIDVTGYYAPPSAGGLYFHPLPKPIRLLETRTGFTGCQATGTPLQTGTTRLQTGVLTCDGVTIPTGAQALVGNATTTNSTGSGYLTLWPADAAQPFASSSNFAAGINRNAPFTVGLSLNGEFNIYTARTTDLVIDVMGYYSTQANDANGQGLLFNSLGAPLRLLDTRAAQPACYQPGAPMTGGTVYTQETQIPCTNLTAAARALVGNVSALNVTANGYLTFWPSNAAQPTVATSNYQTGRTFNRHFTVGLGSDVAFKRFAASTTDVIIDISGFFAP